jgi:anti-anti-sigma regulatory factor
VIHTVSDSLIWATYAAIAAMLLLVRHQRGDIPFGRTVVFFAAFIAACGHGHIVDLFVSWFSSSTLLWVSGVMRLGTAVVSVGSALDLVGLLPFLRTLPGPSKYVALNAELEASNAELKAALSREAQRNERLETGQRVVIRERDEALSAATTVGARVDELERALAKIDLQERTIRELANPILELGNGLWIAPWIGTVDSSRAANMTERLADVASSSQARAVIIDVSGVGIMDTQVAQLLLDNAKVLRLLGTRCVITGIRGAVAQTIVHLGVDFSIIRTYSSLAQGIQSLNGGGQ